MSKTENARQPKMDWGFYGMTPRIVRTQYKELSHAEKWLYTCLKDLCGDKGACFRSLRKLNEETDISTGSLTPMIMHLHEVGLIHAEKKRRPKGTREIWHITIVDIWQANYAYCSNTEHSKCSENEHSTNPSSQCSNTEQEDGINVQSVNNGENNLSLQCSNFATRRIDTKNKDTYEEDKITKGDVVAPQNITPPSSLQEMIAILMANGYQITLENAPSLCTPPLQLVNDTPSTASVASRVSMTPPTGSVAITPRLKGENTASSIQVDDSTHCPAVTPVENSEESDASTPQSEIVSNDTMLAGFASEQEIEAPVDVSSAKGGISSKRGKAKETSSLPPVLDFKAKRAQKVKPVVSEEELALRKEVHEWIDQRRGYKLYGRATPKQVIEENTAVIVLAHMLYLAQYESNVEDGGTWEELKYTWDTIERSDKYWSKPENKGRIGAQAILQMFAPTVQDRRKKQQRLAAVGVSSAPQRQESDLECKNRLLREKYGKRA